MRHRTYRALLWVGIKGSEVPRGINHPPLGVPQRVRGVKMSLVLPQAGPCELGRVL